MSEPDGQMPEDSDDLVAAEYVLGTLPDAERAAAARRIAEDAAFARLVESWEVHLSPLASGYAEVAPPPAVQRKVEGRLFGSAPVVEKRAEKPGFLASLALWRTLAVAGFAAFAAAVIVPAMLPPAAVQDVRYVAALAADGSPVRYLAVYDPHTANVTLSHLGGERDGGTDFELWMIEGGNAPVSMGVIPTGESVRVTVADASRPALRPGAVLAVSREPAGGSPTGQPTGPVVAAGDLRAI